MNNELTKANNQPVAFDYFNNEQFATMQRICTMFASSELVPDMYKVSDKNPKEKAIANCMIAFEISQRIGASALMVMQNMIIIYGKPSWSSKFLVATVNTCGRFSQLKYKFRDLGKVGKIDITEYVWESSKKVPKTRTFDGSGVDNIECIAYTHELNDPNKTELESSPVTVEMAIKEGWYLKAGSKWPTMTKKMLIYRAASFWTNEYAPELSMGMKTEEEIGDITDIPYEEVTAKVNTEISDKANKTDLKFEMKSASSEQQPGNPAMATSETTNNSNNAAAAPSAEGEKNPI